MKCNSCNHFKCLCFPPTFYCYSTGPQGPQGIPGPLVCGLTNNNLCVNPNSTGQLKITGSNISNIVPGVNIIVNGNYFSVVSIVTISPYTVLVANNSNQTQCWMVGDHVCLVGPIGPTGAAGGGSFSIDTINTGSMVVFSNNQVYYNDVLKVETGQSGYYLQASGDIIPSTPNIFSLGSSGSPFNDIFVNTGTVHVGPTGTVKANNFGNLVFNSYNTEIETITSGDISPTVNKTIITQGGSFTLGTATSNLFDKTIVSNVVQQFSNLGTSVNGPVRAIAIDSLNNVYVGGNFSNAGGNPVSNIAKWNGSSWSALGLGVNGSINTIAIDSLNNVYVGGSFTTAGGNPASYIAKWDGTNWNALGSGVNNFVDEMAISGSNVFAGGSFTTAGGNPANYIAKWDGTNWSPLGSGLDNQVSAIDIIGSNVYVGGFFSNAGGNPANKIALWDDVGLTWSNLGSGFNNNCFTITHDSLNNVYAGGIFTTADGNPANYIAKWNGASWSALGLGLNNTVYTIAVDSFDNVYAGGDFTTAGGISASKVAKWDGSSWSNLGSGLNAGVLSIEINSSGNLFLGGFFVNFVKTYNGLSDIQINSNFYVNSSPTGSFLISQTFSVTKLTYLESQSRWIVY